MIQESVKKFTDTMQFKLDKNKHKPCEIMNVDDEGRTWDQCDPHWLLMRIREETIELEKALWKSYGADDNNAGAIILECADIGNFAMMIHDNFSEIATLPKQTSDCFFPESGASDD